MAKTELLIFPPSSSSPSNLPICIDGVTIHPVLHARSLGFIFDTHLSFKPYIESVAKSCRFALHNVARIRPFLSTSSAKTLVHAMVISRLDYSIFKLQCCLLVFLGGTQVLDRKEIWRTKKVFFLTPQVMVNDLSRGICPAAEINLACHFFLHCLPIEIWSEDHPDIQPYSHERRVEKCVVPLGEDLAEIQNAYIQVLETFAGRLIRMRVLAQREIPNLTKYQIILARDQFRKNPSSHLVVQQGIIEGDFALCISLYHGYELLLQMGTRSLYIFLCGIMDGSKGLTRARNELSRSEEFMKLYQQLENMFCFPNNHPKLKKLEEVVVEHFKSWKGCGGKCCRVMIFSSFRDSVQEIAEMLSQHQPIVRVMTFVGHSTGKSVKGFTQKEQLEVVKRFREGGYNTLVSTCVGEEGLDIGEVDLIVCFDAQKSPIRLVQRMGRTGRQRQGRIVVLLTEGREERTYNQSQSNKKSIYKAISENKALHFYQHSPRMIPEGLEPKMHRMYITPAVYEPTTSAPHSKERRFRALHRYQPSFLSNRRFSPQHQQQQQPSQSRRRFQKQRGRGKSSSTSSTGPLLKQQF
uniref:Helicase C-terminal domain-containing protein n=1 Tax=Sphenodon punctatus TaxID=8508 RepID=A0A8D0G9V0_SPHPU